MYFNWRIIVYKTYKWILTVHLVAQFLLFALERATYAHDASSSIAGSS